MLPTFSLRRASLVREAEQQAYCLLRCESYTCYTFTHKLDAWLRHVKITDCRRRCEKIGKLPESWQMLAEKRHFTNQVNLPQQIHPKPPNPPSKPSKQLESRRCCTKHGKHSTFGLITNHGKKGENLSTCKIYCKRNETTWTQ